jgi:hypothetical protein
LLRTTIRRLRMHATMLTYYLLRDMETTGSTLHSRDVVGWMEHHWHGWWLGSLFHVWVLGVLVRTTGTPPAYRVLS